MVWAMVSERSAASFLAKETVRLRVILLVAMSLLLMQSESPLSGEKVQALRAKLVTASIWVQGAPLWVAITVTNLSDHEMRGPVKSVFPFTQQGIRWELRSTESGKLLVQKTRPGLKYVPGETAEDYAGRQRDVKWPVHHVGVGESMRFLFPLSWSDDLSFRRYSGGGGGGSVEGSEGGGNFAGAVAARA